MNLLIGNKMIHKLADVQSTKIGKNTKIWQFCVVLKGAKIGNDCNICMNVMIENDVIIGDNVTVKSGVQLWDGLRVENDVFIGPNVTFTNDLIPRSKNVSFSLQETLLKQGASIGANSVILAGNTIGEYSFIGAGSVVTKNVPQHTIWYGNPAVQKGYITKSGILLNNELIDKNGIKRDLSE